MFSAGHLAAAVHGFFIAQSAGPRQSFAWALARGALHHKYGNNATFAGKLQFGSATEYVAVIARLFFG